MKSDENILYTRIVYSSFVVDKLIIWNCVDKFFIPNKLCGPRKFCFTLSDFENYNLEFLYNLRHWHSLYKVVVLDTIYDFVVDKYFI